MENRTIEDLFLRDYFSVLETIIYLGERVPSDILLLKHFRKFKEDYPGGFTTRPSATLARAGYLKIVIFGNNWRVITLLRGDLAGNSSLPCPYGSNIPYVVIGPETDQEEAARRLKALEFKLGKEIGREKRLMSSLKGMVERLRESRRRIKEFTSEKQRLLEGGEV